MLGKGKNNLEYAQISKIVPFVTIYLYSTSHK